MDGSENSVDSGCQDDITPDLTRPRGWALVQGVFNPHPVEALDQRWTIALDKMLQQQLADVSRSRPTETGSPPHDALHQNNASDGHWKQRITAAAVGILQHRDFELFIVILICLNCFVLALYTPLEPGNVWNLVMNRTDSVLNVAFTVEAVIRVLALGSLRKYFMSPWNAFDALIVSMGYLSYVDLGKQATGVRALRGLRALRPLRCLLPWLHRNVDMFSLVNVRFSVVLLSITHSICRTMRALKPLRIVVDCFFAAAPLMSSVIGLIFFYIFITGLVGMQVCPGHRQQKLQLCKHGC